MMNGKTESPLAERRGTRLLRYAPIALLLVGIAVAYGSGGHGHLSFDALLRSEASLRALILANPVVGPLAFLIAYVLVVAMSFPSAALLAILSGFLFGWPLGTGLAFLGSTIGSSLLFLATSSAFGGLLRKRAGRTAALVSEEFRRDGFGYLLALRLAPFVPAAVVTIVPALVGVRLLPFAAATAIGIVPAVLVYAWLGQGIADALLAAEREGRQFATADLVSPQITVGFAALALVATLAVIVKRLLASRSAHISPPVDVTRDHRQS